MKTLTYMMLMQLMVVFMTSCTRHSNSRDLLSHAQSIVDNDPKQALTLLDSISEPHKMVEDLYMRYILTKVKAKYQAQKDITGDSLIFQAKEYFEKNGEKDKLAEADFYIGAIYFYQGESAKSLLSFLKASNNADKINNNLLAAKSRQGVAVVYFSQDLIDSAIVNYTKALRLYSKEKKTDNYQLQVLTSIGLAYEAKGKLDSAYTYINKTLEQAKSLKDEQYVTYSFQNLGMIKLDMRDYSVANQYLHKALGRTTNTVDSVKLFMHLSNLYVKTNKLDSAKYYSQQINQRITEVKNLYTLAEVYQALADYNTKAGNIKEAVKYTKLHEQTQKQILERNQAQDLRKVRAEADEEHNGKIIFIVTTVCLLAMMGVLTVYGRKRITTLRRSKDEWVTRLVQTEVRLTKQNQATEEFAKQQNLNVLYNEQISHSSFFDEWYRIDKQVKSLGYTLGVKEEPTLYKDIVDMQEGTRLKMAKKGINWAKDYIKLNLPNGEKALATMEDKELFMFMLCFCRYTHKQMAIILNVAYNKNNINMRKLDVRNKLRWAGVPSEMSEELIFGIEPFDLQKYSDF